MIAAVDDDEAVGEASSLHEIPINGRRNDCLSVDSDARRDQFMAIDRQTYRQAHRQTSREANRES